MTAAAEAPAGADPLAAPTLRGYYARIRGLLLTPSAEWVQIARERPTQRQLFLRWVAPLTAVFLIAPLVGDIAFPHRIGGVSMAPSAARALVTIIVGGAGMAAGVWALAWTVDALAKFFGARSDPAQAMKLAVYSGTGFWLAGAFGLAPPLGLLTALCVVSAYTLYRGLPVLMHAPEDKALPYAATTVGAAAVIGVVLMALSSCATVFHGARPAPHPHAAVVAPAQAKAAPSPSGAIDPDKLRRLLPDAMPGGWVRANISRNAGGALGFTGPTVEATYENGARRILLRAIDAGAAAAAEAALRATRPAQDDARALVVHGEVDGRYVFAESDRAAGTERWLTVVGGRIALYAEGRGGVTQGQLQEAAGLIDMVRVEQIARGL